MKKQIKVAYFPSDTAKSSVLGSNGKSLDKYCVKCETEEDLSTGNYILDVTFLIEDNLQDLLQEEVILKVLLDYGYEIFRISKVSKGTRYIDVVARQITISDSLTLWLEDVRPTNLNGQAAVSWMLSNAEGTKEIQLFSDIDSVATAYYQRMSLYKALHDNDNSFNERWGGEIQRRGYIEYINKKIGIDRGFTIREGKNLTGFDCSSNIDKLVTRARGQGFNGILGNYIDSALIGSYNSIYTGIFKYDDVKVKDEYNDEGYDTLEEAQTELDRRVNEEFTKNGIDKIKASYKINFVQLEKTEEYKNYIIAERVYIGDTIRVYIPKLKVDIEVRAMSKKYDILAQKTKEITLSNYIETKPLSIKQIAEKLETMDSTETVLQMAKSNATELIKGGLKDSYVIVRTNEIIIGDTKDINTMTKVWRWNNGGLGYSSTGYNGEFGTAITQDGAIVASFITTGILNASLIRAGILSNKAGTFEIDLENDYGLVFKSNGKKAIDISGTVMSFYDWDGEGKPVGQLHSTRINEDENKLGLVIANRKNRSFTISYEADDNYYGYVRFDKDNSDGITKCPITIFEEVEFKGNQIWFGYDINSIYNSLSKNLVIDVLNDFVITDKNDNNSRFKVSRNSIAAYDKDYCYFETGKRIDDNKSFFSFYDGERIYFYRSKNKDEIWCDYDFTVDKDLHANGNFTCSGTKNCVQSTINYGDRLFYSVEDAESYLTDRSMDLFTVEETVEGTFERVILIDTIFKESVNLDDGYTVEVLKQGWGDYRIKEQTKDYFIVESNKKDFTFKYIVTAKRKGFESRRLEEFLKFENDNLNNELNKKTQEVIK